MKRLLVVMMAATLLAAVGLAAEKMMGETQMGDMQKMIEQGQEVTMMGRVSCTYCYLAGGAGHECTEECCRTCVKSGDSPLLKTEKGDLYLLIHKERGKRLFTDENLTLVGTQMKVTGRLVKTGGIQGIYVTKMEPAGALEPGMTETKSETRTETKTETKTEPAGAKK